MNQVTAFSTAMLAVLTAWLAYDTHRLAHVTAYQSGLDLRVGLVRECDVDTRDDVQAHDALIELRPNDKKDGYEGSDQVSRLDMFTYLKAPAEDYLRCTISNFGKLPLLDVQTVFDADFPAGRKVQIVSTRFHVIAPKESKITWFANNSKATITIHSPHLIRYRTFDQPDQALIEEARPILKDRWVLRSGHDVEEDLDQSETAPFEEGARKPLRLFYLPFDLPGWSTFALAIMAIITGVLAWASFRKIYATKTKLHQAQSLTPIVKNKTASKNLLMLNPGTPINDFANDEPKNGGLGRAGFARNLATALVRYSSDESLCVALYGPWGTGKSSLLNLTEQALKEAASENPPIIVRFNPWNYSDQNQLLNQFFDTMSFALNRPELGSKYRETSEKINKLSSKLKPFAKIPYADTIIETLLNGGEIVAKGLEAKAEELEDLSTIKEEVSKLLLGNGKRVIIMIDDIDRLANQEIRQIFQLVKSVADFSNVIYLLAFDRNVVVRALRRVQAGDGNSYLEKIVNVPIELPPISPSQIHDLLIERLNQFAERHESYRWSKNSRLMSMIDCVAPQFRTIRSLDRLSNILVFAEQLIADEVDYTDFIALSCIQALSPTCYYFIRDNPTLFIETPSSRFLRQAENDKHEKAILDNLFSSHTNEFKSDDLREVLTILFPHINRHYSNSIHNDGGSQHDWVRQCRACAGLEFFQTYFRLEMVAGGLSAIKMRNVLESLPSNGLENEIKKLIAEGKGVAFLNLLRSYVEEDSIASHAKHIISSILNIGDNFGEDNRNVPITIDVQICIMQIIRRLAKRFSEEDRFAILRDAISNCQESLFVPLFIVGLEGDAAGRYGNHIASPEKRLVSDEHLNELESLCRNLIERWAADGRLANHLKLHRILWHWRDMGGGDAATLHDFILTKLPDETFVRLLFSIGESTANEQMKTRAFLSEPHIAPLVPFPQVTKRLASINQNQQTLSEEARTQLATLLLSPDNLEDGELGESVDV